MIKFINKTICMLFTMILVACSIRPGLQDPLIYPQATDISLGTFHPVTGIKEEKIVSFQTSDPPETIIAFYQQELVKLGWRDFSDMHDGSYQFADTTDCPVYYIYIIPIDIAPNITRIELQFVRELCR